MEGGISFCEMTCDVLGDSGLAIIDGVMVQGEVWRGFRELRRGLYKLKADHNGVQV